MTRGLSGTFEACRQEGRAALIGYLPTGYPDVPTSISALRGGVRVRDSLTAVEAISKAGGRAVVMTYWNLVLHYGVDAFARDLASAGGLGMITPDLIPDEAGEWLAVSDAHSLDRIFLVARVCGFDDGCDGCTGRGFHRRT